MATRDPGAPAAGCGRATARVRGLNRALAVVLDGVDLDIAPGEFVAMLGVSGTGVHAAARWLGSTARSPAS